MSEDPAETRVLVTGATGFIAMHCIVELYRAGYQVRGTLRTPARGPALREALAGHAPAARDLELVEADLMRDEGWDEAVAGCRYALHVASPLPRQPPKDENELIVPAREGALRLLGAAARARLQRVVLTSSVAAIVYGHARDGSKVYDEEDWSQLSPEVGAYEKSKTIAEQAAWEFVRGLPAEEAFELAVINPGLCLGPILNEDYGTSGELVRKLMRRDMPGCPDVGWAVVDVRDIASAHLAALTVPEAAGKRFACAIEHASMLDVAKILAEHFGPKGYRIPTGRLPSWLLRLVAVFDKTARLAVPELGLRQDVSCARAKQVLGWQPRGLEEMVVSMGESLIEFGVV